MTDTGQSAVRLPLLNKLLFAADHVGLQAMSYFRQQWVLFFLAPPALVGVSRVPDVTLLGFDIDARVLAGVLIFAGRFIDAFTDPLIGWWSDRTRSRWGRRIPFILFSTPFYAVFGALVWFLPTEGSSWWNALYFVLMLELFFTAATMSSVALVFMFIAGMPMAAVFLLPKGLTADIADYDALVTGERREAMFYATQNFFEKVTYALPPLLLSLILQLGDSAEDPLGIRLAPLLAGALVLLGFALWPRYKLPDTINRETVTAAGLLRSPA